MKIIVEGTKTEIKRAKPALESTCFFDSEFCDDLCTSCKECELNQEFEIKYIVKEG